MSTSNLLWSKGRPALKAGNHGHLRADCLENAGASTSHNRMGSTAGYRESFTFFYNELSVMRKARAVGKHSGGGKARNFVDRSNTGTVGSDSNRDTIVCTYFVFLLSSVGKCLRRKYPSSTESCQMSTGLIISELILKRTGQRMYSVRKKNKIAAANQFEIV
jgi:hypothetical protein